MEESVLVRIYSLSLSLERVMAAFLVRAYRGEDEKGREMAYKKIYI